MSRCQAGTEPVTVVDGRWHGSNAVNVTYRTDDGHPGWAVNKLIFSWDRLWEAAGPPC